VLISALACSTALQSQTIVPGGFVSGNWDADNSPYLIRDDILVHPDSTLMIGAGTSILFSGPFRLEVQGQLLVAGTPSQPAFFDRENDTITWRGLFFNTTDTSITDSSILENGIISHCYQRPGLEIFNSGRIRVSGFIVEYGESFRGAGISCINSNPFLDGLLVRFNHSLDGAGISLENSSPVMKNCMITQNAADGAGGGMVIFNSGAPYLESCTISQNQSFGSGGGIYINDADPVFVRCHLSENEGAIGGSTLYSGGAVSVKLGANPYFENCTFTNNVSHREGGGIATFSVTTMINCLFDSNTATTWGGGVFLSSANISSPLTNCTFSNNDGAQGTALATHSHEAIVKNCIFWHENPINPNSMVFLDSQFSWNLLNLAYSDLQNGEDGIEDSGTTQYTWGPGNINLDPAFLPGSTELSWQSPCIEAGTPDTTGLMLPELDLAGNPRLANDRVDMGGFEYQLSLEIPNSKFQIPGGITIFPNPARDRVMVQAEAHSEDAHIKIINMDGILIFEGTLSPGEVNLKIDLQGYSPGFYLLEINGIDNFKNNKIIILD
jgi:parallel beta-helix repeat protein